MSGTEFLDKLAALPLLHQPGAVWDYGFGLDVLGLVVEQLSEQTLGRYLQETFLSRSVCWTPTSSFPGIRPRATPRRCRTTPKPGSRNRLMALTQPRKFECGGGCAASTASDYMRFALMLMNKGQYRNARVLARKTAEYMVANQIGPEVKNLVGNADPTRADYGFGLGLAVRTTPGIARTMGSVGEFSWPGASGTNWWADPKEELAVVFMAHSPGPIRWHYRQVVNALVYQAIAD